MYTQPTAHASLWRAVPAVACALPVRSRIKAFMHTILTIHGDGLELTTMSGHGDEAA